MMSQMTFTEAALAAWLPSCQEKTACTSCLRAAMASSSLASCWACST